MEKKPNEIMQVTADKIAKMTGYSPAEVAVVKASIAKGTSDTELAYFLNVCKSVGLNPFLKEIWCYKDGNGNVLVFAGRDGFLKKAQESERWTGITSAYVCENDTFEMDIPAGKVVHTFGWKDRGKIVGSYAICRPKGCEFTTVFWAEIKEYDKGRSTWNTNKAAMIVKVAEAHALKQAYGITGLQVEYDFTENNGVVVPVQEAQEVTRLQEYKTKIIDYLETYEGEDKEAIKTMCIEKIRSGEFTELFAAQIANELNIKL
jgi:phage recombination protein Bet